MRAWIKNWLAFAWGAAKPDVLIVIGAALVICVILEVLAVCLNWSS